MVSRSYVLLKVHMINMNVNLNCDLKTEIMHNAVYILRE